MIGFELFPLEKEKERCWYCECESEDLRKMSDSSILCPKCRELKECSECGNMVKFVYSIEGFDDSLCEECLYIELARLGVAT